MPRIKISHQQSSTSRSGKTPPSRRQVIFLPMFLSLVLLLLLARFTAASFVDIGPRSNLLFTPSPETATVLSLLTTSPQSPPTLRGIPRAITYDRTGQVILVSESTTSCITSGQLGIDITVYRPTMSLTKPLFNQTICDDATHVQALGIVADQTTNTLYIAYLVDESPAFINVDKLDSLTGTVENVLSLNATHGQPFTLDVVSLPGARPNDGLGTTRVFAGGNENVWYFEDRVADVALLYPLGNTIVAIATTVLPPTLRLPPTTAPGASGEDESIPDTGARLYAVVRSDSDGALFLHMQDAYNPEVAVADVDLDTAAPMRVLQPPTPSVVHPPRPSANDSKIQLSVPMHHGLVACGEAVYVLLHDARSPAGFVRVRAFSAVDLAEVAAPLTLTAADHGVIVDFACERDTNQLLLLSRATSAERFSGTGGVGLPRESLVVVTPALRILSVQPFGAIVKSVDGGAAVNFRRVGMGSGLQRGMNLVTLMQAVPNPARPDVPRGATGKAPELVLGAMASVNCVRQGAGASSQAQRLQPRDANEAGVGAGGYLCAPCAMSTSASSNPGIKIAPIGGADSSSTCIFLRRASSLNAPAPISPDGSGRNGTASADPSKPCGDAPYYRDERTGQCRICTGEWDGKQCRTVLEADANKSSVRKPGSMSMSVSVLVGTVGAVGAVVGVLGGFLYHRKQQQQGRQQAEVALMMGSHKGGGGGGTTGNDGVYNATPRTGHATLGRDGGGADTTLEHILHAIPLVSAKVAPGGAPSQSSASAANGNDPFKSQPQSQSHTRSTTTETTTSTGVSEMLRAVGGQAAPPIPRALGLVPPRSATSSPAGSRDVGGKKQHEGRPPTDSMQWPGPPAGPPPMTLSENESSPKAPAKTAAVSTHRRGTTVDQHLRSTTAGSVEATLFHSHAGDAPPRGGGIQQSRSVPNNLNRLATAADPDSSAPPPVPTPPALAYLGYPGSISRTVSATLATSHNNYTPNVPPYPYGPWATQAPMTGGSTYDLTTSSGILGALPVPSSPMMPTHAAAAAQHDGTGIPETNPSYVHLAALAALHRGGDEGEPPVPPLPAFPEDLSGIFPMSPTSASDHMMLPFSAAASTISLNPVRRNPSNASGHSFAQSVIVASASSTIVRSRPPSASFPPLGSESPQALMSPSATSTVSVPVAKSSKSPSIVVKRRY